MVLPYFVADTAQVTVLRSLASSSFGKYTMQLPEGIDISDVHTFSAPGNELGYVAALSKRRVGGLCRRFVRADVSVTAANPNDTDWVPDSTVDAVLREAEERVASDFFLESDISIAGLGEWVPYQDFSVGDKARVEIWGQVVELTVTRIEPIITDSSIVDWRVHVGGQIISDDEARLAENELLRRAMIEDRRELAELGADIARAAVETAQAKDTAVEAKVDAESARDDAVAAAVKTANDAVQIASDAKTASDAALAATASQQEATEAMGVAITEAQKAIDSNASLQKAVNEAVSRQVARFVFCDRDQKVTNQHISVKAPRALSNTANVTALGDWYGKVVVRINHSNGDTRVRGKEFTPDTTRYFNVDATGDADNVEVMYQIYTDGDRDVWGVAD